MSSDQARRRWGVAAVSFGLLVLAIAFLALAIVELLMVVAIPPRSSGANIGLPLILLAVLAAGIAAGFAARARRQPPESGTHVAAIAIGVPALLVAAFVLLLVGVGILEELRVM